MVEPSARDLGEGEVDEDDTTLDHVNAQVAWIPVRIRLARRAARNFMTSRSSTSPRFLDRRDKQVELMVEERDVVGDLSRPRPRVHHEHAGAPSAADRLRRLEVEVRLDEEDLHVLRLISRSARSCGGAKADPAGARRSPITSRRSDRRSWPGPVIGHELSPL